jgi:sterol O-acyltransferase
MVITAMIRNYKEMGAPFVISQWSLFTENIWELAVSDLLMAASAMLSLPLHKLYMNSTGVFRWNNGGMIVQALFQGAWLTHWVGYDTLTTNLVANH